MFEIVTTNVAAILTMIVLWCTATWVFTYMYMAHSRQKKQEVIEFLDIYIEEMQTHTDNLTNHIEWQNNRIMELEELLPIDYYPTRN